MKGLIELPVDTAADETQEMESQGLNTVLEMYQEQHETHRLAINTIKDVTKMVVDAIKKDQNARRKLERDRIRLDRDKLDFQKLEFATRIGKPIENASKLSKAALAAKGRQAPKPKTKSGSGARKKTT